MERYGRSKDSVKKHGYDVKFAYHVVRLMDEVEQILEHGDLDITRARETLKSIRRGEWSEAQVRDHFERNEKRLENLYTSSKLPHRPREDEIKSLLLRCLEHHYGRLEFAPVTETEAVTALRRIHELTEGVRGL